MSTTGHNAIWTRCISNTVEENITRLRRQNAAALYREWAQERLAAGDNAKGLEQTFAASIQLSPSMWSQIKSARPISDKLARQIETHMRKPRGWLDEDHGEAAAPDSAEIHFLDVARAAWRATSAKGRRDLLRTMRAAASGTSND